MSEDRLELIRSNMMGSSGVEEKVEVNQRHLIDKILARYSAEYVLYRELMQNSDDASSSSVQIMFHSADSAIDSKVPNLAAKCNRITFKNNGMPFRTEDWNRLKRIAEGNPDEQKIGAFGVGFYSLFSVCESPFVFSGSQCMAFYFKGDQLFAKRADVPDTQVNEWTSFLMDLREPMEMPDLDDFAKFLTTSMGFTANLRQITVYFDQHKIFEITKKTAEPRAMVVDPQRLHTVTPKRMFSITGVDMRKLQLDAEKYTPPTMFTPFANLISLSNSKARDSSQNSGLPVEKSSIFLSVITAALSVNVPRDFEKEMERATKKKPPKTTKFQLVYTGKDELDASENNNKIFKDLMPFPHQGRVFIGFPTHQTTGCCSHMAARFIPTVERESIDFADRYISVWNRELLAAGGLLSRLVYDDEMDQIARLYKELVGCTDIVDKSKHDDGIDSAKHMLENRASHALRAFTFHHSTPSPIVGKEHENRFLNSSKVSLQLMTSHGIQSITAARTLPEDSFISRSVTELLDAFVKTVPTLTSSFTRDCKEGLTKLTGFGLLQPLGMGDILKELNTRALNEDEMVACMKWWVECNKKNPSIPSAFIESLDITVKNRFLDAAILNCNGERLLTLSAAKWWVNPKIIPLDVKHPDTTLPFNITKNFVGPDLGSYFGDLKELPVLEWVRFIASKKELEESPVFAEQVLAISSRGYQHSSVSAQSGISSILQSKTCIPTKYGMKLPTEAYFTSVNLFDDLPIVNFKAPRTITDQFLTSLGVRKHVELQMVFDRLVSEGSWSHVELVKYLTSVQTTLSSVELARLKASQIFTKEGEEPRIKEFMKNTGRLGENGKPISEKHKKSIHRRYKASDLYAPTEALRTLNLPLIQWDNRWRQSSEEVKFLEKLGLQTKPVLSDLLQLASPATNNQYLQNKALSYFVDNYTQYSNDYNPSTIDIDFIPCLDGKTYTSPKNCFTNPEVQILGFYALHPDLASVREKLGVLENPNADRLVSAFLQNVGQEYSEVKRIFEYMAGRMGEFSYTHWQKLRQAKFVPVLDKRNENDSTSKPIMLVVEPTQCYFESEESNFHKELFLYVNFGQLANSFLRSCGVKDEPTTIELAAMLVKDPQRFWNLSGGGERYLTVLRQIAGQYYQIKSQRTLLAEMKSTAFLVGLKRSNMNDKLLGDEEKEDRDDFDAEKEDFVQYRLAKASDIFISDDTMGQQIFSPLSAPMEPLLEEFYANLGSSHLSKNIKESYTFRDAIGATARSKAIAEAILERTPIIIYQMMNDNPQRQKELLHDEIYVKRNLKATKELKMLRLFKHTGEKHVQTTTACADRSSFTVYIAGTGEIDFYDVSNALCTLLFARVRFNDAIIVERYLTASLNNLRRKGVPVDRILNIRKNMEKVKAPELTKSQMSPQERISPQEMDEYTKKVMDVFGDCQEGYIRQLLSQQRENHVENVINQLLQDDYPRKQLTKEKIKPDESNVAPPTIQQPKPSESKRATKLLDRIWSPWSKPSPPQPPLETKPVETIQPPEPPKKPKLPKSETTITPNYTENIKQNLKKAIHSCKPYSDQTLFSPPRIDKVVESTDYCDSTSGKNLTYVGNIAGMDFYVNRGINPEDVLEQYGHAMSRFTSISGVLSKVFNLKKSSLHIFYDTEGTTIAFNTNASLFLNLRFYLALHEPESTEDIKLVKSKRKEALIYWFMTICHELAHNFVSEHNSKHEFYMSSFAEVYLEAFIASLASSNTPLIGEQDATVNSSSEN
ncbi:hypothetical protein F4703DRAFT_1790933 [Phycomyces blakesleeanus]